MTNPPVTWPFRTAVGSIGEADLAALTEIAEGWRIEYKGQLISPKNFAKSVAAFANTYGGWLFVGVAEDEDGTDMARSFPGLSSSEIEKAIQWLRQGCHEYLSSPPAFETQVVTGPLPSIDLSEERHLLAVFVPSSHMAPHIHANGRIYQRVGGSSEPKHVNDRHIVDGLIKRREAVSRTVAEWISNPDRPVTAEPNKAPWVRLLFSVDPWFPKDLPLNELHAEDTRRIFQGKTRASGINNPPYCVAQNTPMAYWEGSHPTGTSWDNAYQCISEKTQHVKWPFPCPHIHQRPSAWKTASQKRMAPHFSVF